MASYTLAQLRELSRQRADQEYVTGTPEASKFVTDAELSGYINRSIGELYDLIISCYGNDYYIDAHTFNLVGNQQAYALPTAFYQMVGVDLVINDNNKLTLKPFMFQERNDYQNFPANAWQGINYRYHLRGDNIVFQPMPTTTNQITIWYIPLATLLVNDNDVMKGFNGWEEYVIIDAAIKMQLKQEGSVEELYRSKQDMIARIKQMADNRDSGFPQRVQDVEYRDNGLRRWM
jgi:hypothetical protein